MVIYKNILLIDDDDEDQEIFMDAVQQITTTSTCVALNTAKIALLKLKDKELCHDVIFLDLNMPIMSGQQFLAEIKKTEDVKHIPVIIFSTTSKINTIEHTKQLGALSFITKPNSIGELVQILTPLLT